MNSIWNKNFSAFKRRFPQLAELAGSNPVPPESLWKLESAKNGMITASENCAAESTAENAGTVSPAAKGTPAGTTVRLHSAYNPEREAGGAVGRSEVFEKSAIVFYGFGLGYHVIECAKHLSELGNKAPKLVLIEPDIAHFYAAMSVLDWTSVFEIEKLVIVAGAPAESVLPLLEDSSRVNIGKTGVSDAYFFDIPAFTAHAAEYFDAVRAIIKRNQRKNEINAATLKKFGRLWCRNSLKNLHRLEECAGIAGLEGAAVEEKLPFLILGAGPSLETILPYIKELSERTITVCVETALHTLLRAGIQPDFILLTDPQFWAYRHIAGLRAPESFLITEVSAYPSVFRFPCKKILLCGSQFPVGQYFEEKLNLRPGDLGTGGSVASCAWNLAHFCGAREIFTAGLDLGFPGGQTHIKGSSAEQTYHTLSGRLLSPDKFTAAALYGANAVEAKAYDGSKIITDSRMKMFAWWFEARLAGCPETKTYTLCSQSLSVPGIISAEVSTLLARPAILNQKKAFLQLAENLPPLAGNKKSTLNSLLSRFPEDDFLSKYPFLREYL